MKSILSLLPVLQDVWSRVYAATIASGRAELDAGACERSAWEAVRRANGGEMPSGQEHGSETRMAILKEAIEQPCPVTGEPFFMVIKHPDLGWVPTYGGPHDSWTAPERDRGDSEEGLAPMLFRYHYDHDEGAWGEYEAMGMRAVVAVRPQEEPTDEEMVEALAPIVAANNRESWDRADELTRAVFLRQAKSCLRGNHNYTASFVDAAVGAIASWKAARAWGRK